MIWLGPHLRCKSQNGCTYAANDKFLPQLEERDVLKGAWGISAEFHQLSPPLQHVWMQPGGMQTVQRGHQNSHPVSGNSIHQWLGECIYVSGKIKDATWRDANSSERPSRFTSRFTSYIRQQYTSVAVWMHLSGKNKCSRSSGWKLLVHKFLIAYLVKTNALDLLVGSYWYINSLQPLLGT